MNTNTESVKVEAETMPPPGEPAAVSTFRGYVDRARTLAKEHPTMALVVAAGAGALFAAEFTLGALTGIGATMLLNKRGGAELRARIARHLRRGRALWPFGSGPRPVDQE